MISNEGIKQLLLSDTLIEDLFIWQYMNGLSKEAICLYLMLRSADIRAFDEKKAADVSALGTDLTSSALAELISSGILTRDSKNHFVFTDLKKLEVDAYCKQMINMGGADLSELELSPLKKERDSLCDSISKSFYAGLMPYVFYKIIDKCLFDYGFETLVIYNLFDAAKEKRKQYDGKVVAKMAEEWHKKGYKDPQKLNEYLERSKKVKEIIEIVGRITRSRVNEYDIERIEKWVSMGIDTAMIEFAFRSCEYKGTNSKNADEVLSRWITAGVTTLKEAEKYESELTQENKSKYKSRKSGNARRTGKAAGIEVVDAPKEEKEEKEESGEGFMDILDMFGGDDDEDDRNADQ